MTSQLKKKEGRGGPGHTIGAQLSQPLIDSLHDELQLNRMNIISLAAAAEAAAVVKNK